MVTYSCDWNGSFTIPEDGWIDAKLGACFNGVRLRCDETGFSTECYAESWYDAHTVFIPVKKGQFFIFDTVYHYSSYTSHCDIKFFPYKK